MSDSPARKPASAMNAKSGAKSIATRPATNGHAPSASSSPTKAELAAALKAQHASPTRFNRDISWLKFNERVLNQALDERNPLLERAKFLAIFTSNLDEFVQKRVAFLKSMIEAGINPDAQQGYTAQEVLKTIRRTFEEMEERQVRCFEQTIKPRLAEAGIELLSLEALTDEERTWLDNWYITNVFPVVTPLAVDEAHTKPFISNLSNNLGVMLLEPGEKEPVFSRIKIPPGLPQWIRLPRPSRKSSTDSAAALNSMGRGRFVYLPDVIAANLDEVFPGLKIVEVTPFRVTRAAEWEDERVDDDDQSLIDEVTQSLKRRRFLPIIRLEVGRSASPGLLRQLTRMMHITADDVDQLYGLLDFRCLYELADLPRPDLKFAPWRPIVPAAFRATRKSIFDQIRKGDVLVHHPYESFADSTERFIREAASDPAVLAIKQTIYRTSRESPFIAHLIKAAESGKQVAALVELRARFDESRNVGLAQTLNKAGVHVAYGVVDLKTHCKAALVVRKEADGLRCYAHIGTGNYNPSTAGTYTDLGLFTCNPQITSDVVHLFNLLTGRSLKTDYQQLLVAPRSMKPGFLKLIAEETAIATLHAQGQSPVGGRIVAKMNALEDSAIIDALYAASKAGVQIDLFVRGFCCLRPGIPGLSENIRIFSMVGRFLEHARVFYFGAGQADPLAGHWYIGSADWMSRNLDGRVEAVCPVLDAKNRGKLLRIFEIMSQDRRNSSRLLPDGRYQPLTPDDAADESSIAVRGTFEALMSDALSS
jgi:polyphosphate kinase